MMPIIVRLPAVVTAAHARVGVATAEAGSAHWRLTYQVAAVGAATLSDELIVTVLEAAGDPHGQYAERANNLSDLTSAPTARANLVITHANLPDVDTDASPAAIHHTLGTTANQAAAGNHAHSGSATLTQLHEHAIGEDLTAETDGAKVTFLTANEFEPETIAVYLAGARKRPVTDYSEDAGYQSITFAVAPSAAAELILDYVAA